MSRRKIKEGRSKLKEIIIEKGYSVEQFLDLLLSRVKRYDREVIRGYIESGKPPTLTHSNWIHSVMIARTLGVEFQEIL